MILSQLIKYYCVLLLIKSAIAAVVPLLEVNLVLIIKKLKIMELTLKRSKALEQQINLLFSLEFTEKEILAEIENYKSRTVAIDIPLNITYTKGDRCSIEGWLYPYRKDEISTIVSGKKAEEGYIFISLTAFDKCSERYVMQVVGKRAVANKPAILPTVEQFKHFYAEKEAFENTLKILEEHGVEDYKIREWGDKEWWTSETDKEGNRISFNMGTGETSNCSKEAWIRGISISY